MTNIILASKSPRRAEIMRRYCPDLKIVVSELEENIFSGEGPETAVMRLAFEKATEVLTMCDEDGIIVAADTVVYTDEVLGKPRDRAEGRSMLERLSGRVHRVYTGLCLVGVKSSVKVSDYEMTEVEFYKLKDDEIEKYLNTEEYADKAGAYGIQGYGELFVKSIRGCYNNVKGLPVAKLNMLLKEHFSVSLM